MGAAFVPGSLDDLDLLRRGAAEADGVSHTAFGIDFSNITQMSQQARRVIEAFGEVSEGSGRHGFVPMLAAVVREKGVSAHTGDGDNLWPSVHRLDAARVFCLGP